jgi:hypothetical protein
VVEVSVEMMVSVDGVRMATGEHRSSFLLQEQPFFLHLFAVTYNKEHAPSDGGMEVAGTWVVPMVCSSVLK